MIDIILCVLKKALARYFAHACKVLRTVLASVDGMFELLFDLLGPLTSRGAKARARIWRKGEREERAREKEAKQGGHCSSVISRILRRTTSLRPCLPSTAPSRRVSLSKIKVSIRLRSSPIDDLYSTLYPGITDKCKGYGYVLYEKR